jgi:ribulose bisphosphate carboxylase small subunit
VTLEFERAPVFRFSSTVVWPSGENLDKFVEAGVLEALDSIKLDHTFECRLVAIRLHPIDSCGSGFKRAARYATYAAIDPPERLDSDPSVSGRADR